MQVQVELFGNLADHVHHAGARGSGLTAVELPDGATVADLVLRLGLPVDLPRLLLVNGQDATPDRPLDPGDAVSILPPLVGGSS